MLQTHRNLLFFAFLLSTSAANAGGVLGAKLLNSPLTISADKATIIARDWGATDDLYRATQAIISVEVYEDRAGKKTDFDTLAEKLSKIPSFVALADDGKTLESSEAFRVRDQFLKNGKKVSTIKFEVATKDLGEVFVTPVDAFDYGVDVKAKMLGTKDNYTVAMAKEVFQAIRTWAYDATDFAAKDPEKVFNVEKAIRGLMTRQQFGEVFHNGKDLRPGEWTMLMNVLASGVLRYGFGDGPDRKIVEAEAITYTYKILRTLDHGVMLRLDDFVVPPGPTEAEKGCDEGYTTLTSIANMAKLTSHDESTARTEHEKIKLIEKKSGVPASYFEICVKNKIEAAPVREYAYYDTSSMQALQVQVALQYYVDGRGHRYEYILDNGADPSDPSYKLVRIENEK